MSLARNATASRPPNYQLHQPEQTLLYQLVDRYYPAFKASLEAQGRYLPRYIQQEFIDFLLSDFLQCGRLAYGFLRVRCEACHHERLVAFSCKRRGFCPSCGARQVRYELKTPYRNGTTHVIFELMDFIAKLAALVPKPRVNLSRFHRVFAPNSQQRAQVTPTQRGRKPDKSEVPDTGWGDKSPAQRQYKMNRVAV